MIKKLEAEDISKILYLKDSHFGELFECEIGEWVQFLMQNVDNEFFFMAGNIEDEKLTGYLIAYFMPLPICKKVSALYSKSAGLKNNKLAMDELKKWAKEKGANGIDIITKNTVGHSVYGFKKKASLMTIDL